MTQCPCRSARLVAPTCVKLASLKPKSIVTTAPFGNAGATGAAAGVVPLVITSGSYTDSAPVAGSRMVACTKAPRSGLSSVQPDAAGDSPSGPVSWYGVARPAALRGCAGTMISQLSFAAGAGAVAVADGQGVGVAEVAGLGAAGEVTADAVGVMVALGVGVMVADGDPVSAWTGAVSAEAGAVSVAAGAVTVGAAELAGVAAALPAAPPPAGADEAPLPAVAGVALAAAGVAPTARGEAGLAGMAEAAEAADVAGAGCAQGRAGVAVSVEAVSTVLTCGAMTIAIPATSAAASSVISSAGRARGGCFSELR